jgi:hypothetical protein
MPNGKEKAIDAVKQALEKQYRPLVVLTFPLNADCSWASPWIVQEKPHPDAQLEQRGIGIEALAEAPPETSQKGNGSKEFMIESSHDVNEWCNCIKWLGIGNQLHLMKKD